MILPIRAIVWPSVRGGGFELHQANQVADKMANHGMSLDNLADKFNVITVFNYHYNDDFISKKMVCEWW